MDTGNKYMRLALESAQAEAIGNEGHVGAVLVSEGDILAIGVSNDEQGVHAEQAVFRGQLQVPHNSTLYVTVQPSLYRTDRSLPSDSDLIAKTGIMHVVVGSLNKKYDEQESKDFFAQHDMTFKVIGNSDLSQECLDYFLETGASQK